jgi:uncharacterized phage protein (TIGR02218 family)
MPVSVGMKNHLAQSPTTLCTLWRVEERRRERLLNWETSSRVNVEARGGWLRKNDGTDGSDDAGAFSNQSFDGDGYLRWVWRARRTAACGLSASNGGADEDSIDFAIQVEADGTINVIESGSVEHSTSAGAARRGDWLVIKRIGTEITYWHNRTLLYTSALTSSGALFADASITTKGATIEGAVFGKIPTVITLSNHTRNLTYQGEAYTPAPLSPSRLAQSAGLKPDNAEIAMVLASGQFTKPDLIGGRWNHARAEIITVNYADLTLGHARRKVGYFGEVQIRNGMFTAEFRGLAQLLDQETGESTSALCRAKQLGDERCGLDLTDHMFDAAVTAVTDGLRITIDLSPAKANDYFKFGLIYFRSGNNLFYEREIKSNTGNDLELARPMPLEVEVGDLVTVIAGCPRTRAACKAFPNPDNPSETNIENFVGEPDIPGLNKVYEFPE